MKSLLNYILESVDFKGSSWYDKSSYSFVTNHYNNKITSDDIKEQLKNYTENYKWSEIAHEWIIKDSDLNSEEDIENWLNKKIDRNEKYRLKDFEELVKNIYDGFTNYYSGTHEFIKDKDGNILKLEDWLKTPCQYDENISKILNKKCPTWEEHLKEDWNKIQKDKNSMIEYLTNFAKSYLNNSKTISEETLRNIKLKETIFFGRINKKYGNVVGDGKEAYLKISNETVEGKTLVLTYTDNKEESIKFERVGDVFDLLFKYKTIKIETPEGVLNTRWANSINLKFTWDFKEGELGILRF